MPLSATLQKQFFRWALRGGVPEPVPIVLGQQRVYVLPTRQGLAFGVTLVAMLIGAINYNLSLGYALVFLLTGLGIVSILHTFRNLAHLQIRPGRCEPVFAGKTARFGLILTNLRDAPRTAIRLNLPEQPEIVVDLPAEDNIEVLLDCPAPQRGWLNLPRVRLATTYPLGLIRTWGYAVPELRCLVYPAPAQTTAPIPAAAGDANGIADAATGMDDFAGLRNQQPADPLRHIAWKAVARQDPDSDIPLLTKLFSGTTAETLWFDWDTLPAVLDTEARLSLLTRWIVDAHCAGRAWGLRLPGSTFGPAADEPHFHTCLKHLALYGQE